MLIITKKKFKMRPVFGGHPFRLSLVEFGAVTGLPCGPFEEDYNNEYQAPATECLGDGVHIQ
ncbi:LOW QUALITY PROTEIN: hypothetical protein HID58_001493 [Brassica napus]|uniref:DUF1985 domain-containing protein n=1 Tax=Brassica napus TaxID=3708 RepID=A0ABQ8EML4_BRANA|nr:LOW QUALITY PROTEIN: hypothetical protein HID58_001493 [Brassica napus]